MSAPKTKTTLAPVVPRPDQSLAFDFTEATIALCKVLDALKGMSKIQRERVIRAAWVLATDRSPYG